jgi:hypothetical protein
MQNELLKLTKHIGFTNFINHSDEVYASENIDMKKFEYLLIKTGLEKYVKEIAELCLFARQNKHLGLPKEKKYWEVRELNYKNIQIRLEKSKILKMLIENQNETEIKINNQKAKIHLNFCKDEVVELLLGYFENDLFANYQTNLDVEEKIEILNNNISHSQKFKPRRGAPPKNQYIGTLAEIIICIMNFSEYCECEKEYQNLVGKFRSLESLPDLVEINETNFTDISNGFEELDEQEIEEQKQAKKNVFENDKLNTQSTLEMTKYMDLENIDDPRKMVELKYTDCILVHDILCFWGLIDDVRKKEIFKDTPYDNIRNMIRNLRTQRPNIYIQGSGKAHEIDTYLI